MVSKAAEITPKVVGEAVTGLLIALDDFSGGYGVAPKFPREPLFLLLLDEALRHGHSDLLAAVTAMLDGMMRLARRGPPWDRGWVESNVRGFCAWVLVFDRLCMRTWGLAKGVPTHMGGFRPRDATNDSE